MSTTIPTANQPAAVEYKREKRNHNTYFCVNGPEPIDRSHLAEAGKALYVGTINGDVTAQFAWTIDDSTDGRLPVTVNGIVQDHWLTNSTDRTDHVYKRDTLPLTVYYNGKFIELTYDELDPRTGLVWSWANWGVVYHNEFTIHNSGTKTRKATYMMSSTPLINRYIGTYSPANTPPYKAMPFSDINNWLDGDRDVLSVEIQPGETVVVPVAYVLGGQSCGGIGQYIVID